VNPELGLADCKSVRTLKIFIECDPSDGIFAGFRQSDGFYEGFCQDLLRGILEQVESVEVVEFDAWESVQRDGDMVVGMRSIAVLEGKNISWGPERGWRVWADVVVGQGNGLRVGRTKVVFSPRGEC
jgi:hypothetical protein